jgi:signal transduction histidine kinase
MKKRAKLTTLIILFPLMTLLLYGLLSYLFLFYSQKTNIKAELKRYELTLMQIHESALKEKVDTLAQFIHYYDNKSSDKIKEDAKSIVSLSVKVANNIIDSYENKLSKDELKELIINALKDIKFENNLGYLFLLDTNGKLYIHKDKNLIGKNLNNLKDINGKYIIKEFANIIKSKNEGYLDYYWYMPGKRKDELYYKISYVKKINKLNWYIGAGEYLKYMKEYIKKDMLKYIEDNYSYEDGYMFITNSQNSIVFAPKEEKLSRDKLIKYRMDGIYKDNEIFAYTKYIPEYDWYITAIKKLKNIQKSIEAKKEQNEKRIERNIRANLYIMLATWLLSILLSLYLSTIINKMLKRYEQTITSTNEKLIFQSRQALLGELLPMIAHQWRQPINKIASVIALLRFDEDERKDEKRVDEYYKQIENNVEFMSETIDDFREFYQPKQNKSFANLKELIEKSIEFVESVIRKKDIKLTTQLEDITHKIYINEFLQVMINIIKNATDALEEGGEIAIRLYRNKGLIVIEVEDNGKGIDEQMLDKIFEPYVSTKENSMGLGLYMSKIIIEKHMHGVLKASNNPSKGACFTIIFKADNK